MRSWLERNFALYIEDGTETEEQHFENTSRLVDLCMYVIAGLALLTWGMQV